MVRRLFPLLLSLLLLTACAAPQPRLEMNAAASALPAEGTIYILPFLTIMVPDGVREGIFDRFVDELNQQAGDAGYRFVILKEGREVDAAWLKQHPYLRGEIFGYVEDSGCCNTSLRLRSRLAFYLPENDEAALLIDYPRELFFDHDSTTVDAERIHLADEITRGLAETFLSQLLKP